MGKRWRGCIAILVAAGTFTACGDDSGVKASDTTAAPATTASTTGSSGSATTTGSSASGGTPTGAPYKIGINSPLSGFGAGSYVGTPIAAQAWEKWVNANGGVNGHPVQVIVKDSGNDASKGLAVVRDLVENDKVQVLIPNDPSTDNTILPYTQDKKFPVVQSYAAYPIWNTTPGWFALGLVANPVGYQAGLNTVKSEGKESIASALCAEVAACGAAGDAMAKEASNIGVRYDGTLKISATAPNYTAECLLLKNKKTEVIFAGLDVGTTKKLVSDCAAQDYHPSLLMLVHSLDPRLTEIPGASVVAIEPTLPWYADTPAMKDFRDAMTKYGDLSKANETSMFVWTSLEFIRQGLKESNVAENPTPQQTMDALYKVKTNLGGLIADNVSFTAGQPSPVVKCYFVGGFENGKFTLPRGDKPICVQ